MRKNILFSNMQFDFFFSPLCAARKAAGFKYAWFFFPTLCRRFKIQHYLLDIEEKLKNKFLMSKPNSVKLLVKQATELKSEETEES